MSQRGLQLPRRWRRRPSCPPGCFGVEQTTGSIAVGKAADLVRVEGDPSQQIGDLRNSRVVMKDGTLFDADALRAESGFAAGP